MDETEELLEKQLDRLYQMNRIEKLSLLIEEEKQKGDLSDRLSIVDNKRLIYKLILIVFVYLSMMNLKIIVDAKNNQ